jgi:5,6,7,8-tetrahydromethanopterin hydro-lyase
VSADREVHGFVTQIGEAFVGSGPEAAHLNTVLGAKGGPVETAWITALATPRAGHAAFLTTVFTDVSAKPMTLFVNKATLEGPSTRP